MQMNRASKICISHVLFLTKGLEDVLHHNKEIHQEREVIEDRNQVIQLYRKDN